MILSCGVNVVVAFVPLAASASDGASVVTSAIVSESAQTIRLGYFSGLFHHTSNAHRDATAHTNIATIVVLVHSTGSVLCSCAMLSPKCAL